MNFSTFVSAVFYLTRPDSAPALLLQFLSKDFFVTKNRQDRKRPLNVTLLALSPCYCAWMLNMLIPSTKTLSVLAEDIRYCSLLQTYFAVGHCRGIASGEILHHPCPLILKIIRLIHRQTHQFYYEDLATCFDSTGSSSGLHYEPFH